MNLGLSGYGSDDDESGDDSASHAQSKPPAKSPVSAKPSLLLPRPAASVPKKRTKKITIGLPNLLEPENDDAEESLPPAKKPRLENGTRSSMLVSMLPAPKQKAPVAPERVLGGGSGRGLDFRTATSHSSALTSSSTSPEMLDDVAYSPVDEPHLTAPSAPAFLPQSVKKGKANISLEETSSKPKAVAHVKATPAVDFFSLGESSSNPLSASTKFIATTIPKASAAPAIEEFIPPEPTREDAYPGYYQLPSGQWRAHDPDYYKKFYDKWKKEYDNHVRALEKGIARGFEGAEDAMEDIDAQKEMERAKAEVKILEERKALTRGGAEAGDEPAKPKMNIGGAKLGGVARSRHQLSTLLTEAYQNREALEERIAQGRRNRKEAGNKYGF